MFCAESKLRCEGTNPCQRCHDRGLECNYTRRLRKKSRRDAVSEGTDVRTIENPVSADEGDPASSSEEQEEYPENHEPGSSSDAADLSQLVAKHLVDTHGDSAVQPFTPKTSDTSTRLCLNACKRYADTQSMARSSHE
jgi:hypothetical protein